MPDWVSARFRKCTQGMPFSAPKLQLHTLLKWVCLIPREESCIKESITKCHSSAVGKSELSGAARDLERRQLQDACPADSKQRAPSGQTTVVPQPPYLFRTILNNEPGAAGSSTAQLATTNTAVKATFFDLQLPWGITEET